MSNHAFVPWLLAAVVGCGPVRGDTASSESTNSTNSTNPSSGTSGNETGVDGDVSSESGSSSTETAGGSSSGASGSSGSDSGDPTCDTWSPPLPPYGWSLQDCSTEPCPQGEVCRYDPQYECGAHPVCVDPGTLQCNCEIYGPLSGGLACPCPGYDGPVNELGQVVLECNTFMSPGPVESNKFANCIN